MDVRHDADARPAPTTEADGTGLSFERLVFFSDAVFAIVITLLVLPLTAEIHLPEEGVGLADVLSLWPAVLTFVVSFLVVGQFWVAHHRTFGLIRRHDHTLVWLNLVTLLTVAFLTFPSALLGARTDSADAFPVVFYAASLTVTSASLSAIWVYAAHRGLLDESVGPSQARRITRRALVTAGVFLASIPAALLGLPVAVTFWLVLLPVARTVVMRTGRAG
jgi:uncharacterized membrane protein